MKKRLFYVFLIGIVFPFITGFSGNKNSVYSGNEVIESNGTAYLANIVIIKFKENKSLSLLALKNHFSKISEFAEMKIVNYKQMFSVTDKSAFGLDNIFSLEYSNSYDPAILSSKIAADQSVEYAEPKFVYKTDYIPNDPYYQGQYNLSKIQAAAAWDVSKGDSSVVIGIIDTGIYWAHPDLSGNIWMNKGEIPGNGIDDDQNGFIDDVRGWDFGGLTGNPDNNPVEDAPDHGTHVAGIASAMTNNNIGIAGIGFKCKLMAVKVTQNDNRDPNSGAPYILYGYEGIKYAADNGAKVINCSFSGGGYSAFGQNIIDYAASKGALVVVAAGNKSSEGETYPAGYKNVLSVAATDQNDLKSSYSNYNYYISISAPGNQINSTWEQSNYALLSGTSMSSPLAAGVAGLVKSVFPGYTPEQIAEKIRVSADDITGSNPGYTYKIGKGRLNAFRAVSSNNDMNSVRLKNFVLDDSAPLGNSNGILEPNESAKILCQFKNILNSTSSLNITLSSLSTNVTVESGSFSLPFIQEGEGFMNSSSPFIIKASSTLPFDSRIDLLFSYSAGSYSDYQVKSFYANPTFVQSENGTIDITIGSQGNFAFNNYPTNTQGKGFHYNASPNLLFEGGLMIGTGPSKISDRVRGTNGNVQNLDFTSVKPVRLFKPGNRADIQTISEFNDNGAGASKIGVGTILNTYSYSLSQNDGFILLYYDFYNPSTQPVNNFYAGLYLDWDMIESTGLDDLAKWEPSDKFGYVYHIPRNDMPHYVGCGVVSNTPGANAHYRSILNNGNDGGWGVYDGFADSEKWEALSGGITKPNAGAGDVSQVIASGPYTINGLGTINVVFAICAGDSLQDLKNTYTVAKSKWEMISSSILKDENRPTEFSLLGNFPNPFNPSTTIEFSVKEPSYITLVVYNSLGEKIKELENRFMPAGNYRTSFQPEFLAAGVYYYRMDAASAQNQNLFSKTGKMLYLK